VGESLDSVAKEIACMSVFFLTPEIKLIVPVLNRFDLLQRMINSIDISAIVYVVNNSGSKQSVTSPDNVRVHWINLPSNLGVASSWNLGIKMLPFESRWFFTSADCWFEPGALSLLLEAKEDAVTLCSNPPYWQTFAIGQKVVDEIGLFDEGLHPAYFEDNDFMRRCENAGIRLDSLPLSLNHENSSTIKSDTRFADKNTISFSNNQNYFNQKIAQNNFDEGHWKLNIRRTNSWD
jgi:GT2 family glycosyltransferase